MFPLRDSVKSNIFPAVNILIIGVTLFVFFKQSMNPELFLEKYALIPSSINFNNPLSLVTFITPLFLHGGLFHVLSNMWFLWVFGDNIEAHLGKLRFLLLYFGAGIIGNMAQFLLNPNSAIPLIGASGAVSGILGAYYILFPHSKIKSVVVLIFFITIIDIPAVLYLFYWFIIQFFSGVASLPRTGTTGGIAFWAHVGGFVAGVFFAKTFGKPKNKDYIEGEVVG